MNPPESQQIPPDDASMIPPPTDAAKPVPPDDDVKPPPPDPAASSHLMRLIGSSADLTWATPRAWFEALHLEFKFSLDPCCTHENAKCPRHYTPAEDGLAQSWAEERVFMNPPYGRELPKWMRKAYEAARDHGALVVCFVPARVDTEWWHRYAAKASEIRFPIGRVKFEGADAGAPFPIAIIIFRPRL